MKIRKGDNVVVISWQDKWKTGKVLKVLTKTNRVIVEWVRLVKRHIRRMWSTPWTIITKENPIDVSNVMLICPITGEKTRVWYTFIEEKGVVKKYRYSKKALKIKWGDPSDHIIK